MALVVLMSVTLVVLAVLQYRWIGEIGRMERIRLREGLENAAYRFRTEFNLELRRICLSFELGPDSLRAQDWDRLIERYDYWLSEDRHAKLVEDVFLQMDGVRRDKGLFWLDFQTGRWLPSAWTGTMGQISQSLDQLFIGAIPGSESGQFSYWRVLPDDLVLIRALVVPGTDSATSGIAGFLFLVFNESYFENEFLPGLMQHHFNGRPDAEFDAAVVIENRRTPVLVSSKLESGATLLENPSLRIPLLGYGADPDFLDADSPGIGTMDGYARPNEFIPPLRAPQGCNWELVADYRGGPLEVIVSRSRRRNLAVSFGILLLLGIGMALIVWGARRSRRLAELQMRFVAGVSHDLRTPLSVIGTAADNLAEGIVEDSASRVKEYGALIRSEGRKLSAMVEQILQYADLASGRRSIHPQPFSVGEILSKVLAEENPFILSLGFILEKEIPPDLPDALGDPSLLEQALQNLISNALKHGASNRWARIRAERVRTSGKDEIAISVDDRGTGIDPGDAPHVFEPFYRGRNAAGVPGSGLGLTIVKQSLEMMGGRVSLRSDRGGGCSFTIYLRSAGPIDRKS